MLNVITDIAKQVKAGGGRTFLVGGPVRDQLLGRAVKDYDLEIFGLAGEDIRKIVERFGPVKTSARCSVFSSCDLATMRSTWRRRAGNGKPVRAIAVLMWP